MSFSELKKSRGGCVHEKFNNVTTLVVTILCVLTLQVFQTVEAKPMTRFYDFNVESKSVTKLCKSRTIVTVNGQYPGPTIYAQEGDRIIVTVTNSVSDNVTLHWHGVRQRLSCWSDGPAYVTQCPIQSGETFTYEFTLTKQKGTLFWHAHVTWLRATVHGAIVIYPKAGVHYPFPFPHEEHVIILGEYWLQDVDAIEQVVIRTGGGPPTPDAYVLNGHPGPLFNCSANDVYELNVIPGKTYLLRLINAALNDEHFFSVAKHHLTVVEADGEYTVPYTTESIVLTPGQTINVLVTANKHPASYYMGMTTYSSNANVAFLQTPSLALFHYRVITASDQASPPPIMPDFPANNDTTFVNKFARNLKSFASVYNTVPIPQTIDRNLFFTVGLNEEQCEPGQICKGPNGGRFSASINNVTFELPTVSILQAYYQSLPGVYTTDFPVNPTAAFDFVNQAPNNAPNNTQSVMGTRVNVIEFNENVQIIMQNTGIIGPENHPIHLHGFSFYVVGFGSGNYKAEDAKTFNLKDPPLRNTIGVPAGGWAAIRFQADNPGVWYLHCHLEIHTTWGLSMAFIVKNGVGLGQTLPGPPADLPAC